MPPARAEPPSSEDLVDALEALTGKHAGKRRGHAKGFCAAGEFVSNGAGARWSKAATFAPNAVLPTVVRFSLPGPNPAAPDNNTPLRGLALSIDLPGGDQHQFVMLSSPMFAARTPETFIGLLRAAAPDPATGRPNPEKIGAFVAANPDTMPQIAFAGAAVPSASYATERYFAIHSFFFADAAGTKRAARWTFEPVAGRVGLTAEQRTTLGPDFLPGELRDRLTRGPAEWRVYLQPAEPNDPIDDSTLVWPTEGRERLEVGSLRVTSMARELPGECDGMMFNPLLLPEGVDGSDDPILQARPGAYAVSLTRRTN